MLLISLFHEVIELARPLHQILNQLIAQAFYAPAILLTGLQENLLVTVLRQKEEHRSSVEVKALLDASHVDEEA